jgi:copper homeostasis protein
MHPPPDHSRIPLLEVAVETLQEAVQAELAGAQRLEVCTAMSESGLTPSIGLVSAILEHVDIQVFVMIRPRGGDFTFDEDDLDVMRRDIDAARSAGAHGIVSGVLNHAGGIDAESTKKLVEAAHPLPFTFHRAFDLVLQLEPALAQLRSIGVRRVLTSGGASTAIVGADAIARLRQQTGNGMSLIAGGGIRPGHVAELVQRSGVMEVHARPTMSRSSGTFVRRDLALGTALPQPERNALDAAAVRAIVRELASLPDDQEAGSGSRRGR